MLVEISPYDLSRGRITYRERNAGGSKPTTTPTPSSAASDVYKRQV